MAPAVSAFRATFHPSPNPWQMLSSPNAYSRSLKKVRDRRCLARLSHRHLSGPHAAASAKLLRRGVKEVVKALRKSESGLCVLAADISPIDVISHIPVLCEDTNVPYIYVSSKVPHRI